MLLDKFDLTVDWDKLKIFYFVAKIGSFTQTAQHLHTSQSSISRKILILEGRLECQLFFRVPRGLHLTPKGQIVFEWVAELFQSLESMKERLQIESEDLKGSLKVATTNALASAWIVYYLPKFVKTHENLDISIIGNGEEMDLTLRQADVLIRPYINNRSDLLQTFLMSWQLKLYAHPSYLAEFGTPQTIEDLGNHHLLSFGDTIHSPYQDIDWLLKIGLKEEERRKSRFKINSSHGLLQAAEAGLGIISFSQESPLLKNSTLVSVLPHLKGPKIDIYYIYPKEYDQMRKIKTLLSYLKEKILQEHKFIK